MDAADPGFAVYVHWPFCAAKCPYCDFNSHVRSGIDQDRWRAALIRDLRTQAAEIGPKTVNSIFFGGGTPSLMPAKTVEAVIDAVGDVWSTAPDLEVTLEANPTSVEAGRFTAYREAGVNRVSLGVQSLIDEDLKALGRLHSATEALAAFDIAKNTFDRVSLDLIYARQNQSLAAWERELTQALGVAADHLSLYQLTIEPGTAFGARASVGRLEGLPSDNTAADMYDLTQALCEAEGLVAYEVSNHAAPGAECRHNLVYWRYGDYCGVGPGAHGRIGRHGALSATVSTSMPERWLEDVETNGHGVSVREEISSAEQAEEMLLMGMRLTEGISLPRFEHLSGQSLDYTAVVDLISQELITQSGERIAATQAGRRVLNRVILELLR